MVELPRLFLTFFMLYPFNNLTSIDLSRAHFVVDKNTTPARAWIELLSDLEVLPNLKILYFYNETRRQKLNDILRFFTPSGKYRCDDEVIEEFGIFSQSLMKLGRQLVTDLGVSECCHVIYRNFCVMG